MRSRALWLLACSLSAGCAGDLGPCDETSARDVVYLHALDPERDGLPAYAGQALIQRSCGDAAFCHAEDAIDRYGAPAGLTLDIGLACADPAACDPADLARLERAHGVSVRLAWDVYAQTASGAMPPGEAGTGVVSVGPRFRRQPLRSEDDSLLPPIGSDEGLAILRNWLACGAPVVATTEPESAETAAGTRCPASAPDVGDCVVRAGEAP